MGFLKKDKKRNPGYDFNYHPMTTLPLPSVGNGVTQLLEKQEKPEEKLGLIERTKIFFNKLGIRFSKLFVFVLAPVIFGFERFYINKYNFAIFAGTYIVAILLSPVALKSRGEKIKERK